MAPTAENIVQKFTYSDYVRWDDGERWELIDGIPYNMTPAPALKHQNILLRLASRIGGFLEGKQCTPFVAPTDVVLDDNNVVQPDLLVVCEPGKLTEANIAGAPDLVVEILSPATSRKDRREKKALYERFGVREYILIDPANETVERFLPVDGRYGPEDVFGWEETMALDVLPGLELNLWEIFDKEKVDKVNEPHPRYSAENC